MSVTSGLRDHPRVCGEEAFFSRRAERAVGSPPRVRGGVCAARNTRARAWITPACAGRRASPYDASTASQDHPRVCGEESNTNCARNCPAGSPPRVRGGAIL